MVIPDQLKAQGLRRLTRNGITFYACLDYRLGAPLRAIKKWRGYSGIEDLSIIQAAIRRVAWFASQNRFELVTVPPQSGVGESFAERLATRMAAEAGLPFELVFKVHGMGKRYGIAAKTKPVPVVFTRVITGARILVFDDFSFTRLTMARSIEALWVAGNECEGIVLC